MIDFYPNCDKIIGMIFGRNDLLKLDKFENFFESKNYSITSKLRLVRKFIVFLKIKLRLYINIDRFFFFDDLLGKYYFYVCNWDVQSCLKAWVVCCLRGIKKLILSHIMRKPWLNDEKKFRVSEFLQLSYVLE
jgi:hypothetical protein